MHIQTALRILPLVLAGFIGFGKPVFAVPLYTIQALGPTDAGLMTWATAINNAGQAVGYIGNGVDYGGYHAVLFSGSSAIDLGAGPASQAASINDKGEIVGTSRGITFGQDNAFIYSGGNLTPISFNGQRSAAYSINNLGQVVGYSELSPYSGEKATIYQNGTLSELTSVLGNGRYPYAINDNGVIVGDAIDQNQSINHAFVFDGSSVVDLQPMIGLGNQSTAIDVNDHGDIIGVYFTPDGSRHSFLFSQGTSHDIGSFSNLPGVNGTAALSINEMGVVVGFSELPGGALHPFIYINDVMTDLTTLVDFRSAGWTDLMQATGINDIGQIVGVGTINGQTKAFLLNPVSNVPEPAPLALSSLGFFILLAGVNLQKKTRQPPSY